MDHPCAFSSLFVNPSISIPLFYITRPSWQCLQLLNNLMTERRCTKWRCNFFLNNFCLSFLTIGMAAFQIFWSEIINKILSHTSVCGTALPIQNLLFISQLRTVPTTPVLCLFLSYYRTLIIFCMFGSSCESCEMCVWSPASSALCCAEHNCALLCAESNNSGVQGILLFLLCTSLHQTLLQFDLPWFTTLLQPT